MLTETLIEDPNWQQIDFPDLAETASRAVLGHLDLDPEHFEIAILACDDARIATLNADFRGKPQPTNVLSWPEEDLSAQIAGQPPEEPPTGGDEAQPLGDIAIAFGTCQREAEDQNKRFDAHVTHLVVHGVLHLLGYDHIRDKDATVMEAHERAILGKLGISDPYRDESGD
ncbi:rRNA maturation RNase YbeY [Marinovum sp. 2_MG-2023]|uniref:rRNA maturation RNase YbeY n=1 Tax=unclassified Marinovum TaxID=2647166 RepID=UPI0026E360D2|nr:MULTISPECIES: rRNA maturation RNase YbeY [unclassified Marinovum]MDO6729990.1 rRNA maturation RNase YbeY [Marinovum sp. 2_MG-2023]MDO6779804.1 rRNA maturation RNase YbeY [Marinovum sp. 1_MG-2023]